MYPNTIPIRLTLAELCAAALENFVDDLENARDAGSFLVALEVNHRLWLALEGMVENGQLHVDRRAARDAVRLSASRGIPDLQVAALTVLERAIAAELVPCTNLDAVRARIRMAYRESGCQIELKEWLLDEIGRKRCLQAWAGEHPGAP